jgi:hypothetical protein
MKEFLKTECERNSSSCPGIRAQHIHPSLHPSGWLETRKCDTFSTRIPFQCPYFLKFTTHTIK